jgi:hypothetical protein
MEIRNYFEYYYEYSTDKKVKEDIISSLRSYNNHVIEQICGLQMKIKEILVEIANTLNQIPRKITKDKSDE